MKRNVGFTLIEILVVVAIVTVLAAMLLPLGQRMLMQSRQTKSLSNARLIGQGLLAYAAENAGAFPPHLDRSSGGNQPSEEPGSPGNFLVVNGSDGSGGNVRSWQDMIYPFVGSSSAFKSPFNPHPEFPWPGYAYNSDLSGELRFHGDYLTVSQQDRPRRIAEIERPSLFILCAELVTTYNYLYGSLIDAASRDTWSTRLAFFCSNKGIFVFADGHTELLDAESDIVRSGNHSPNFSVDFNRR